MEYGEAGEHLCVLPERPEEDGIDVGNVVPCARCGRPWVYADPVVVGSSDPSLVETYARRLPATWDLSNGDALGPHYEQI